MRKSIWPAWAGAALSVAALFSYPFIFVRWPVTRDVPWVNLLIFVAAGALTLVGIRRGFAPPRRWLATILTSAAAALTLAPFAMFVNGVIIVPRRLPASAGAPRVGERAPDFTLPDANNQPVALSALLTTPVGAHTPRAVLLIFYRGYW